MTKLTAGQVAQFNEEGYLAIPNLFDPAKDLDPVIEEYAGVLDRLAHELHERGEISSKHEEQPFGERLIRISEETKKVYSQHFDFMLPARGIRPDTPMWLGPAVFRMMRNERLLDAVEGIVGPEIYSNPIQHVRLKLPVSRAIHDEKGNMLDGTTTWHQDNGVVLPEADNTNILTVWFPLWDAPLESGCLQVMPRSHRRGLLDHCFRKSNGNIHISDGVRVAPNQPDPVSLPLKRGDVLFMHRLMCHAALPNESPNIRFSMDLRYNPIGQATGRDAFPGFVARSRAHPETELHDARKWAEMWYEARRVLGGAEKPPLLWRWGGGDPNAAMCA